MQWLVSGRPLTPAQCSAQGRPCIIVLTLTTRLCPPPSPANRGGAPSAVRCPGRRRDHWNTESHMRSSTGWLLSIGGWRSPPPSVWGTWWSPGFPWGVWGCWAHAEPAVQQPGHWKDPEKAEGKETGVRRFSLLGLDVTFLQTVGSCDYIPAQSLCHLGVSLDGLHHSPSTSHKLWDRVDALTPSRHVPPLPLHPLGPGSAAPLCLPLCRPVSHTAHISVHLEQMHPNFLVLRQHIFEFEFTEWKASRFTLNKSTDRDWRWKWKWSFRSYGKHLLGWGGAKELVEKIHSFMLFFFKGNICQHMWDILEGILHVICFHSYHPMKKTPVYFYRWVNGEDLEFDN